MPINTRSGDELVHSRIAFALYLTAILTVSLLIGCGDAGPERVIVAGTVAFNGKPLPSGMILFVPTVDSSVPASGASIVDGRYKIDGRGGAAVGSYRVQIEAFREKSGNEPAVVSRDVHRGKQIDQYLPARYNARTELQVTVESGKREFTRDFDLTD